MPKRKLPSGGGTQVALSPELAIAAIGFFSTFMDGQPTHEAEITTLAETLCNIDLYTDYSDEDFQALGSDFVNIIKQEGVETVVGQAIATAKDEELEEIAYAVALLVVAADGEVPDDEQEYVDNLSRALGISAERAGEIIDELFPEDEEDDEEVEEEEE